MKLNLKKISVKEFIIKKIPLGKVFLQTASLGKGESNNFFEEKINNLLEKKHYAIAEKELINKLLLSPQDDFSIISMAILFLHQNNIESAENYINRIDNNTTNSLEVSLLKDIISYKKGEEPYVLEITESLFFPELESILENTKLTSLPGIKHAFFQAVNNQVMKSFSKEQLAEVSDENYNLNNILCSALLAKIYIDNYGNNDLVILKRSAFAEKNYFREPQKALKTLQYVYDKSEPADLEAGLFLALAAFNLKNYELAISVCCYLANNTTPSEDFPITLLYLEALNILIFSVACDKKQKIIPEEQLIELLFTAIYYECLFSYSALGLKEFKKYLFGNKSDDSLDISKIAMQILSDEKLDDLISERVKRYKETFLIIN